MYTNLRNSYVTEGLGRHFSLKVILLESRGTRVYPASLSWGRPSSRSKNLVEVIWGELAVPHSGPYSTKHTTVPVIRDL